MVKIPFHHALVMGKEPSLDQPAGLDLRSTLAQDLEDVGYSPTQPPLDSPTGVDFNVSLLSDPLDRQRDSEREMSLLTRDR